MRHSPSFKVKRMSAVLSNHLSISGSAFTEPDGLNRCSAPQKKQLFLNNLAIVVTVIKKSTVEIESSQRLSN